MEAAVREHFPHCDILVMAAAVADYRLASTLPEKRKKTQGGWALALEPTADILSGLKALRRAGQFICGFAAETEEVKANARRKLAEKGLDLIAANDVSCEETGFDSDRNALSLLWPDGSEERVPEASKAQCAQALWDAITEARRGA
jgi:phosphopantothenoylcysteine decarboxylase/phosphopantothenate--cysteine ligase